MKEYHYLISLVKKNIIEKHPRIKFYIRDKHIVNSLSCMGYIDRFTEELSNDGRKFILYGFFGIGNPEVCHFYSVRLWAMVSIKSIVSYDHYKTDNIFIRYIKYPIAYILWLFNI